MNPIDQSTNKPTPPAEPQQAEPGEKQRADNWEAIALGYYSRIEQLEAELREARMLFNNEVDAHREWRLRDKKAEAQLVTANATIAELQAALEKIAKHDTHNLHNSKGNAYRMAQIAIEALKENDNELGIY